METKGYEDFILQRRREWDEMKDQLVEQGIQPHYLWETGCVPEYDEKLEQAEPALYIYPSRGKRGIIIVCAGGGFTLKSYNEAKPVAEMFIKAGLNAAILDYRYQPYGINISGGDGLRAVRYLRYYADKLGIDGKHIAIGGFSAGGVIGSYSMNHFDYGKTDSEDPIEHVSSRPDAIFEVYGSFRWNPCDSAEHNHISGFMADSKIRRYWGKQDFVINMPFDAPPAFLVQPASDEPKLVLDMAAAYAERGIPCECHLFSDAEHGGGLWNGGDEASPYAALASKWPELAVNWFKYFGF